MLHAHISILPLSFTPGLMGCEVETQRDLVNHLPVCIILTLPRLLTDIFLLHMSVQTELPHQANTSALWFPSALLWLLYLIGGNGIRQCQTFTFCSAFEQPLHHLSSSVFLCKRLHVFWMDQSPASGVQMLRSHSFLLHFQVYKNSRLSNARTHGEDKAVFIFYIFLTVRESKDQNQQCISVSLIAVCGLQPVCGTGDEQKNSKEELIKKTCLFVIEIALQESSINVS